MTPKETALLLAKALDSRKGINIKVLETGHLTRPPPPPRSGPSVTPVRRP